MTAALYAGRLAAPGSGTREVARAITGRSRPSEPRAPDLVLDGLAALFGEGYTAGVPVLRRALAAYGSGVSADDDLPLLFLAGLAAEDLWDDAGWDQLSARAVRLARAAGALTDLLRPSPLRQSCSCSPAS
jgi:hypothetical protein